MRPSATHDGYHGPAAGATPEAAVTLPGVGRTPVMRAFVLSVLVVAGCGTAEVRATPPPAVAGSETAYLAGGCFWGMEEILRKVPGVIETDVGKVNGAETVRVV